MAYYNFIIGLIPRALFLGEMRNILPVSFELRLLERIISACLDCSHFKRNRRNISHFAEKKRPWNQAFRQLGGNAGVHLLNVGHLRLGAEGSVIIGEYSPRLRLGEYSPIITSPSADDCWMSAGL